MGEFLKLAAFAATAAAAVVVAKEVIERNERGEDCSPLAVVKGIGRKIGDFCREKEPDEDFENFEPFCAFDDDDSLDFDTADMESDKLDDDEFVQLQIEIETAPEAESETATEAATEAEAESAVEEALKNAAGIDDEAADESDDAE